MMYSDESSVSSVDRIINVPPVPVSQQQQRVSFSPQSSSQFQSTTESNRTLSRARSQYTMGSDVQRR